MKLKIKRLTETAKLPQQAHPGDLYDIFADEEVYLDQGPKLVKTGLAFEIPKGYQIRLYNRSSNALTGVILANGTGVIDTSYRGEIKGLFYSLYGDYIIHKGDKIMQMELVKLYDLEFEEVENISGSSRGAGGFGSTGR